MMSLTNIFREPKKELIELSVGFAFLTGIAMLVAFVAAVLCLIVLGTIWVSIKVFVIASVFASIIIAITGVVLSAMHAIGEYICDEWAEYRRSRQPRLPPSEKPCWDPILRRDWRVGGFDDFGQLRYDHPAVAGQARNRMEREKREQQERESNAKSA